MLVCFYFVTVLLCENEIPDLCKTANLLLVSFHQLIFFLAWALDSPMLCIILVIKGSPVFLVLGDVFPCLDSWSCLWMLFAMYFEGVLCSFDIGGRSISLPSWEFGCSPYGVYDLQVGHCPSQAQMKKEEGWNLKKFSQPAYWASRNL